jgi:putative photosynthetic complex assembly protein 2
VPTTGLAIGYVLVLWWVSTGLILYLDGLPRRTFRWTILGATILLAAGVFGLVASRDEPTVSGALTAFTSAILVWGWNEVLFLTGALTGSNRDRCPEGVGEGRRFRLAASAILHHELGLAASGLAVLALTWGADNTVGGWTFAVLWVMRLSAKLNIFLGVPNVGAEFLPAHLAHLASFFRQAPMNPLFPASLVFGFGALALLVGAAVSADTASFERIAATLVATLLGLALVEHLFMVLPIRSADLWRWGFASHNASGPGVLPGPTNQPGPGANGRTGSVHDTTRGVP